MGVVYVLEKLVDIVGVNTSVVDAEELNNFFQEKFFVFENGLNDLLLFFFCPKEPIKIIVSIYPNLI